MSDPSLEVERIDFWTELVGTYFGNYTKECFTYFKIGKKTLTFRKESKEADKLRLELKPELLDQLVGILRTNSSQKPFIVRKIKGTTLGKTEKTGIFFQENFTDKISKEVKHHQNF